MKGNINIEVRESVTALKKMLRSERNSFRASRLFALILYKSGEAKNSSDLAKAIGYTADAIEDWFEKYKSDENLNPSLQIHNGLLLSQEVGDSLSLSVSKLI